MGHSRLAKVFQVEIWAGQGLRCKHVLSNTQWTSIFTVRKFATGVEYPTLETQNF